jgi:ubiquilin
MEAAKIKVILRQSSGDQFEVEIPANASVKDLKEECAKKQTAITADEMRLIFKGKILKDELTLDEYKIADGLTIHLVKGSKPGATGSTQGSSLGGTTSESSTGATGAGAAGAGVGAAGANPFAGMGGMGFGGMPMGGFGNPYGGMGGPGMGMPSPEQMGAMMNNPMV